MKIVSFQVNNYRSYKDTYNELEINNDISVIVGQNNVGKTNILRAIFLFFNHYCCFVNKFISTLF